MSEQLQYLTEKEQIPQCRNSSNIYQKKNKYYAFGTAPISNRKTTNTAMSEQLQYLTEKQQIPHCREQLQYLTEKQQILHCRNSSNI
jgi:hypothetical protein